jgi:hypothetical protein
LNLNDHEDVLVKLCSEVEHADAKRVDFVHTLESESSLEVCLVAATYPTTSATATSLFGRQWNQNTKTNKEHQNYLAEQTLAAQLLLWSNSQSLFVYVLCYSPRIVKNAASCKMDMTSVSFMD